MLVVAHSTFFWYFLIASKCLFWTKFHFSTSCSSSTYITNWTQLKFQNADQLIKLLLLHGLLICVHQCHNIIKVKKYIYIQTKPWCPKETGDKSYKKITKPVTISKKKKNSSSRQTLDATNSISLEVTTIQVLQNFHKKKKKKITK